MYDTVHYVRAIHILHFWQLLINVFLVIFVLNIFICMQKKQKNNPVNYHN